MSQQLATKVFVTLAVGELWKLMEKQQAPQGN